MARRSIVHSIASTSIAAIAALALAGCLGGNANGIGPTDGTTPSTNCEAGELSESTRCSNMDCSSAGAGYVPRLRCLDDGSGRVCGCFRSGMTVAPPATNCVNGTVSYTTGCRTDCGSAQVTSATCVSGAWADCRCVDRSPGGTACVANSITENGCGGAVCPAGQYAGQQCNSSGNGYGVCMCFVRSGMGATCNTGYERACSVTIACNTGYPREVCNGNGAWGACQCVGGSQTCVPGASAGSCTCAGGVGGVQYCNSAGNGYTCSCSGATSCNPNQLYVTTVCSARTTACPSGQVWHQQCTSMGTYGDCQCALGGSGSTGGAQTMRIEIDPAFWEWDRNSDGGIRVQDGQSVRFCSQSNLNVRCFIAGGEQVREPRTTDRTLSLRDWKAGYVNCDVTCGSAADSPVHPLLWRTGWASLTTSTSRGIRTLSVTGGPSTSSMGNQVGTARFCQSPGGIKIRAAIDPDQEGICS